MGRLRGPDGIFRASAPKAYNVAFGGDVAGTHPLMVCDSAPSSSAFQDVKAGEAVQAYAASMPCERTAPSARLFPSQHAQNPRPTNYPNSAAVLSDPMPFEVVYRRR